jgi:hypothetical protein
MAHELMDGAHSRLADLVGEVFGVDGMCVGRYEEVVLDAEFAEAGEPFLEHVLPVPQLAGREEQLTRKLLDRLIAVVVEEEPAVLSSKDLRVVLEQRGRRWVEPVLRHRGSQACARSAAHRYRLARAACEAPETISSRT